MVLLRLSSFVPRAFQSSSHPSLGLLGLCRGLSTGSQGTGCTSYGGTRLTRPAVWQQQQQQQQQQQGGGGKTSRPCITYWLGKNLYVALTNRCNATPLHVTRGPGFKMPSSFSPLPPNYEPSAREVQNRIDEALIEWHQQSYMANPEVTMAGWGEPTLRWETACLVAEGLRRQHPHLKLRLNTNGLGNAAEQRDITGEVADLFSSVSVALNTADPMQYEALMMSDLTMRSESTASLPTAYTSGTPGQDALELVMSFLKQCKDRGLVTEVTAVARPDVDVGRVEALAQELGARFRSRPFFE